MTPSAATATNAVARANSAVLVPRRRVAMPMSAGSSTYATSSTCPLIIPTCNAATVCVTAAVRAPTSTDSVMPSAAKGM